jgi:hypothetical protein
VANPVAPCCGPFCLVGQIRGDVNPLLGHDDCQEIVHMVIEIIVYRGLPRPDFDPHQKWAWVDRHKHNFWDYVRHFEHVKDFAPGAGAFPVNLELYL